MKYLFIILIFIPFLSFSQSKDSIKLIELERKIINDSTRIDNLIKENKAKDSLLNQLQIHVRDNRLAKEYYSWNIGTLSVVISIIAAILLFVVGYIIPKNLEKKYQKKLNEIDTKLIDIDTKYQELNKSIEKNQNDNRMDFCKSMFFISDINTVSGFLWAIRYLSAYVQSEKVDDINDWIVFARVNLNGTKDEANEYKKYENEMTEEFDIIKNKLNEKEGKKDLKDLEELHIQFKKLIWSESGKADKGKS